MLQLLSDPVVSSGPLEWIHNLCLLTGNLLEFFLHVLTSLVRWSTKRNSKASCVVILITMCEIISTQQLLDLTLEIFSLDLPGYPANVAWRLVLDDSWIFFKKKILQKNISQRKAKIFTEPQSNQNKSLSLGNCHWGKGWYQWW